MSEKLTPWFPAEMRPERVGVYLRNIGGIKKYALWDGYEWRFSADSIGDAAKSKTQSFWTTAAWRGLTKEAK